MKFTKKILKNGLRLITVPMRDNPTVTMLVMVEAGSKYETKKINGLSHFLEHMCFKGTEKRPKASDISRELDSIGAQYNAFTGQEYTGYYAKADARHLDKVLDVVSDMYLHPVFKEEEIEKEKGVICEEINMYEDQPMRDVQNLWMKLLYGDQPAGWDIAGTKEIVRSLKRNDFVSYRKAHYVPSATTVIVAGGVSEEKVQKAIEDKFGVTEHGKKSGKIKTKDSQAKPKIMVKFKETDQTHLVLGVRSFDIYNKINSKLRLLTGVLSGGMSSRLFHKLRDEMGVCYYVRAENDPYTDHGAFQISAGVDNKRVKEVIVAVIEELKRLKNELVSAEELRKVKDYLIGNLFLSLESSDSLAEYYGFQEVLRKPLKKPEEIVAEIEKVTAEDIQEVAKKIFVTKHLNLALIGRFKDTKEFAKLLKL
jgi:predicted Zn-dependent peptidase